MILPPFQPSYTNTEEKYGLAYYLKSLIDNQDACLQCMVAGSIRRQKQNPKDIELCVLTRPGRTVKQVHGDLFTGETETIKHSANLAIMDYMQNISHKVIKRGDKYAQFLISDIKIDLFQTDDPQTWGLLQFIRTGPDFYVQHALRTWKELNRWQGYSKNNVFYDRLRRPHYCRDEKAVFDLLGWDYVKPQDRGQ